MPSTSEIVEIGTEYDGATAHMIFQGLCVLASRRHVYKRQLRTELARGQGANHDASRPKAGRAEADDTHLRRNVAHTAEHATSATGTTLHVPCTIFMSGFIRDGCCVWRSIIT